MLRAGLQAMLAHWWRHPAQLAMALLGLALATALWSGVQAINAEARASYARAEAVLGQDRLARLVPAAGARLAQAEYVALRRAGWQLAPVIEGDLRLEGIRVRLIGIDPLTAPPAAQPGGVEGTGDLAAFIRPPGLFLAAAETAARLAGRLPGPVRVDDGVAPGVVLADVGIAQSLLGAGGQLSHLLLWPDQPAGLPDWQALAPGLRLEAPEGAGDLARLTDSFHLNLTAFGLLSFVVGLFIVHAAVGLAFEQRRPMFRTFRALGLPVAALVGLLLAETVLMALVAGLAGVALGWLVAALLMPDVAATLRGLYGAEVAGGLALRPEWWATGLALAVLGALAAVGQSLWRLARMPPLAPAQPRAWARASARALAVQAAAGAGMLALALPVALGGRGLVAGFAGLGLMLAGAALLLPGVLALALALAGRGARGVLAGWFWADTRQQLPGLSLALMALLLALAANLGVGTMVASFRHTFTGWLDQRLAAELYVTARTEAEAAEIAAWLAPRAEALLPIWSVEAPLAGMPGAIFGVADHATYRDHWPLLAALPDAWDRVAAGEGAMVNEQLARRAGLAPGDALALPQGATLRIVGVYSDYGNPAGQAMIAVDRLVALAPDLERRRYAVRVAPERAEALARDLGAAFDLPAAAVVDQAAVKRFSLAVFERTFAVTAALNVLTLGVAALALLASLVTLAGQRLPQLAPVWAAGLTRRRLAGFELLRAAMLAALTMAAALPLGLALAWMLLAVVNVAAFGWRLPMHLFPADWLRLALLALAAALLAAALPARRLARMAPADLLRLFANER